MRSAFIPALALAALLCSLHAQSFAAFETAIVRPSGPDSAFRATLDASQFIATKHTLSMLIASSYPELPSWRMTGGPAWLRTDFWDFTAKLPPGAPQNQEHLYRATEQMLRTFLAQTFQLKTHFEKRDQPVYELVASNGPLKLKLSDAARFSSRRTPDGIEFRRTTMQQFANFLYCPSCAWEAADRPVFDKTGTAETYDFTLNWTPSSLQDSNQTGPSIFTAMQELGLKLLPAKGSIDFRVIDHAERPQQN